MIIKTDSYQVDCSKPSVAVISGKMRLPSPSSYEEPFQHILTGISDPAQSSYLIDITGLDFLNSSGIAALGRFVFIARQSTKPMTIRLSKTSPWQDKIIGLFKRLYDGLLIENI